MITTKTGDKGQTTCGNKRVDKDDLLIEVIGTIDELISILGVIKVSLRGVRRPAWPAGRRSNLKRDEIASLALAMTIIQKDLMNISSELACGVKFENLDKRIKDMEKEVEAKEKEFPQLKEFIIPGKNNAEAMMHLGRVVCRKVERRIVSLNKITKINPDVLKYFNRLSDYLFIIARQIKT